MKKATLKTYLITLLVLLLAFAMMLTAFACTNPEDQQENEPEETASDFKSLVSNGDFSGYSESGSEPYSPNSWTAYTPDGYSSEDKVAGVVTTGADYAKNSSAWGNAANPFGEVKDEKVLMIYNKAANVYGYTNTFSADAGSYYKVSVKVKTVIEGGGGATFRLSSDNGFTEFGDIPSSAGFDEYTVYVLSPAVGTTSLKVTLSLGYGGDKVKGYAFFDDVKAEKITESDYTAATVGAKVKKISMLYPDGEFNYYTYSTTTPYTALGWTVADGNSSGDHGLDKVGGKSLSTANLKYGVLSVASAEDWKDENYGTYPGLPVEESEDQNILYLGINKSSSDKYSPSAFYYYSNKKVRIELASLYEISVWVKATVESETDQASKGARLVLKGTDEYSSVVVNTTASQATNNGWVKVVFYVLGNQVRNKDFEIQLWLGDDKDSSTLTQGKAFFDKLSITKVKTFTDAERAAVKAEKQDEADTNNYVKVVDLVSLEDDLIANNNFTSLEGYEFAPVDNVKVNEENKDVIVKIIDKATLDATEWTEEMKSEYGIDVNPKYPYAFAPVLIVNNTIPSAYTMKTSELIDIEQSQCYRLSVWMKTIGLDDDSNVTLKLENEEGSEISSFSVNTAKYENDLTNNYAEYSFYLKGALPVLASSTTNTNKVRVVISNGSGTAYDPSSFKKGAFLVANVNMEKIKFTEYDSASTGDYAKKKDFAENDSTVTNGNFNSYNLKNTEIDSETGFVAMADKDGNTHLVADVSDWTNNVDKRYGTTKQNGDKTINHNYYITKNDVTALSIAELVGRTITTIRVIGPDGYDKTFDSDSEWNKLFSIDAITNELTWASSSENISKTLTKSESNNAGNYFDLDLTGKAISKISISGPSDYSKTLLKETEWEKYFSINYDTNKIYWADTKEVTDLAIGSYSLSITLLTWSTSTTKSDLTLSKTATENEKNSITLDEIKDKAIVKIVVSGGNSFSATWKNATDWNKYLSIDTETGKISWANTTEAGNLAAGDYKLSVTTDLKAGEYTLTVTYDEIETNDLIAGIINVNASAAYLAQFGLTADAIYDQWSTTAHISDETTAKAVTFGAPNLLMITTRDGRTIKLKNTYVDDEAKNDMTTTPAVKSPTVSLSANSYYLLKCYAKAIGDAIGEIYVTTTSTDTPFSAHVVQNTNGWVEYNFIVETGLSSVSAAFELYFGEKGNADASYTGTLLFDSFSYKSLTEEEYKAAAEREDTKDSKFTTITFDNSSAKDTAVSPSGFSAKNSSSSNSDTQVSGIIAKDHYAFETSAGKKTLGIYETVTTTDDDGNETSKEVLSEGSSLTLNEIFNDAGMEDGATVGDYLLMINNRKATYQSYYLSSLSLESNSYYRFSAYVRTAKIAKDKYAKVYVSISDEPISFEINTEYDAEGEAVEVNEWKKLTFYFKNEKSSSESAYLYFQLGDNATEESKMKGYLFIDNVSLSKITADEYETATADNEIYEKDEQGNEILDANNNKVLSEISKEYRLSNIVTVLKDEETDTDGDGTDNNGEEEKTPLNTTLLWTYITSIVIAVILIAVIVILLIKKYRRPKKETDSDEKATYDRTKSKEDKTQSNKSGTARDEYKD